MEPSLPVVLVHLLRRNREITAETTAGDSNVCGLS
jgi:hypothetical protein